MSNRDLDLAPSQLPFTSHLVVAERREMGDVSEERFYVLELDLTRTSNAPFLSLPSRVGAVGPLPLPTGSNSIGITVSPNSGASRTGTVSIGGQTVTITQDGSI